MFDWHALTEILRSEKVHQLSKGVFCFPHTCLEPLSQSEIIVTGGDSFNTPSADADTIIMDTVRNTGNSYVLLKI